MSTYPSLPIAADARLNALIQELSRFGLGVFRPHKHLPTGEMVPLPEGEVVLERRLRTHFVERTSGLPEAVPVGWRWNGTRVEVFALCCDRDDEFNPPACELEARSNTSAE